MRKSRKGALSELLVTLSSGISIIYFVREAKVKVSSFFKEFFHFPNLKWFLNDTLARTEDF